LELRIKMDKRVEVLEKLTTGHAWCWECEKELVDEAFVVEMLGDCVLCTACLAQARERTRREPDYWHERLAELMAKRRSYASQSP
jgi:hypothetical protein